MGDDVAARLERLESVIDDLRAEVDVLRAENTRLRHEEAPTPAPATSAGSSMGRRRLLVGGATAGAAAVAGVVATGQPAAAANGGPMVLGNTNEAASETKLVYQGSGNNGFRVEGTSSLALIEGFQTGTGPGFKGANTAGGPGVNGTSNTGIGVYGQATGASAVGVRGDGDTGVLARSSSFRALHAESSGAYGITVSTGSGAGINVTTTDGGNGIEVTTALGGRGIGVVTGQGDTGIETTSPDGYGLETSGGIAALLLGAGGRTLPPTADTRGHLRGEVVIDGRGEVWLCTTTGTPGSWRKVGGSSTAGQLHVLSAPARVYDSRPGTTPTAIGPKTKFAVNETRTFDLKANGSTVPAGATAALVTILLVNASTTPGNATIWANGVTKPLANTMVWGGTAGRFTATATTALDSLARIQFNASQVTDLVLDVVGYYR